MVGWMKLYERTKKKLDRELNQQELDFLKWVCNRKEEEEAKGKTNDS